MIQTIIGNLINNAIKFSNSLSEIIISVKDNRDHYILSVKDHGIGIEESQLRSIFLLGEAQTGRGTMGESGTGLGLVLVKDLIDILKWKIEVKSKINKGTEFLITIPAKKDS
jgi:signal transduction histidine kinase